MQHDGFVQDVDSEEYFSADLPDVDFDQPIDPDNPGFGSLLPALRAVRSGQLEVDVLDAYVEGLGPRLEATFAQWESVAAQPLEQMGLEEEQVSQLRGAFAATEGLLQELDHVLGLIERGGDGDLEEAEQRLSLVHNEIRAALG